MTNAYVVTGAGRGVGRAVVERLARHGRVIALDIDPDALEWTSERPNVDGLAGDRSESQVVEDAMRAYLRSGELEAAGEDLPKLMNRIAERANLDDESAMNLAVDEVRAARASRDTAKSA